jgi:hypothetical protein
MLSEIHCSLLVGIFKMQNVLGCSPKGEGFKSGEWKKGRRPCSGAILNRIRRSSDAIRNSLFPTCRDIQDAKRAKTVRQKMKVLNQVNGKRGGDPVQELSST